jgi:hypothetical protein
MDHFHIRHTYLPHPLLQISVSTVFITLYVLAYEMKRFDQLENGSSCLLKVLINP